MSAKPGMTLEELEWLGQYLERMDAVESMLDEMEAEVAAGYLTSEEARAIIEPVRINAQHMAARIQLILERLKRD